MKKCKHTLTLKIHSIEKNANDLFDNESKNIITETYSTNKECFIYKSDGLRISSSNIDDDNHQNDENQFSNSGNGKEELVGYISCNQHNYFFERKFKGETLKGKVWIPIKELHNDLNLNKHYSNKSNDNIKNNINNSNSYILHQGDIIKFGRIELKVKSINLEGNHHKPFSLLSKPSIHNTNNIDNEHNNQSKRTCRICFGEDETESPLINPCKCAGGVKYIHLHCLQQWLKTKRIARSSSNENCSIYTYKKINCELCKTTLPDFVQCGNDYYEIWKFSELPQMNHIIFESFENINHPNNVLVKTIYVVNFENKNIIKIGRSHEAELRIRDVSISRLHASIELVNINNRNEIILKDNKSKFGSIVELQCDKIPIYDEPGLTLQFGKSIVNFIVKTKSNMTRCLSCGSERINKKEVNYNKLNNEHIDVKRVFTVKEEKIDNSILEDEQCLKSEENENKNEDDEESDQDIENDIEVRITTNQDFNLRERNRDYFGMTTCDNELNNETEITQFVAKVAAIQNPIRLVNKLNENKQVFYFGNENSEKKEKDINQEDDLQNKMNMLNESVKKNIEQEDKETFVQDLLYSIHKKETTALINELPIHKCE